jgi:hypothetical protein
LFGSLTYQTAGQLLTLISLFVIAAALWLRKQTRDVPGSYLPFVALGVMSFLMFLTGIVATHFLLALPLLILCRRWMDRTAYWYAVVVWTIGTFIPMFGDMGLAVSGRDYALLDPDHNPLTRFVIDLYGWDRFITVTVVANLCAVVWLGFLALRRPPAAHMAVSEAV